MVNKENTSLDSLIQLLATAQSEIPTLQQTIAFVSTNVDQWSLAQLKQQAVYDETTKASYVFSMPIQDDYLDALMQKENIYYADPHVLVVQIEDDAALVSFQKV